MSMLGQFIEVIKIKINQATLRVEFWNRNFVGGKFNGVIERSYLRPKKFITALYLVRKNLNKLFSCIFRVEHPVYYVVHPFTHLNPTSLQLIFPLPRTDSS